MRFGIPYRPDMTPPDMSHETSLAHDKARTAAFLLRNAADHLRKYADLLAEGIERPANVEIAMNNIKLALDDFPGRDFTMGR